VNASSSNRLQKGTDVPNLSQVRRFGPSKPLPAARLDRRVGGESLTRLFGGRLERGGGCEGFSDERWGRHCSSNNHNKGAGKVIPG